MNGGLYHKKICQFITACAFLAFSLVLQPAAASAQDAPKPNILVIMGDDIGIPNLSAYSRVLMGYKTPDIDRIADDKAWETDLAGFGRTFPHPYGEAGGRYYTTLLTLSPAGDYLTLPLSLTSSRHQERQAYHWWKYSAGRGGSGGNV